MDWAGILAVAGATGVVSVPIAFFLAKLLVQHRLRKDLKDYENTIARRLAEQKADLDAKVSAAKSAHEASLKREVEEYLGDRAADRSYVVEAKKRLYLAVGPMRFQLLLACSDFASRVRGICVGQAYDMSMDAYFGRSTAYRLLRILSVCELIERQVAFADFAVDPAMRSLLHFRRKTFDILSNQDVTIGHPSEDWTHQNEHFFKDVLGSLASALIVHEGGLPARVMRFEEFAAALSTAGYVDRIHPVPRLVESFSPQAKPLLWLRLLALARLCNALIESQGVALGIEAKPIDCETAFELTRDAVVMRDRGSYLSAVETATKLG